MSRHRPRHTALFVAANDLQAPTHVLHDRLNKALAPPDFNRKIESIRALP